MKKKKMENRIETSKNRPAEFGVQQDGFTSFSDSIQTRQIQVYGGVFEVISQETRNCNAFLSNIFWGQANKWEVTALHWGWCTGRASSCFCRTDLQTLGSDADSQGTSRTAFLPKRAFCFPSGSHLPGSFFRTGRSQYSRPQRGNERSFLL